MEATTVDTVVDVAAACTDRQDAETALAAILAGTSAPIRGDGSPWRVVLTMTALPAGGRAANAIMTNDAGQVVSERIVEDPAAKTCAPLARAVGAWAALVLDDELSRAERPLPEPEPLPFFLPMAPSDDSIRVPAPHPLLREAGVTTLLRSGFGSGTLAGVSPFFTIPMGHGAIYRPALLLARSAAVTSVGFRSDFCGHLRPGLTTSIDLCGGIDSTYTWYSDVSDFRFTVGPSATIERSVGASLSMLGRAMGGFAIAKDDVSGRSLRLPFGGAVELGIATKLP